MRDTNVNDTTPRIQVQSRVTSSAVKKLDELGQILHKSRSRMVDIACIELARLSAEDILKRQIRRLKDES